MVGKLRLTGFVAWLMWLAVHLVYLTGFKNRVTALLHWVVSLPRPRPLRAHHHRAADLRPQPRWQRLKRRRLRPGLRARATTTPTRAMLEATRRAELEAQAAEEARLTDAGERGVHHEDAHAPTREPTAARRPGGPAPLRRARAQSSMTWTAASSALAPAPSMPTSSPTRSVSTSGPRPSSSSTSRPARSVPTSPPTSSVSRGRLGVRVRLGLLLRDPLVEGLADLLLVAGCCRSPRPTDHFSGGE